VRIVDSQLGGPSAGLVWNLARQYVHPRLEQFSFDPRPAREAIVGLVRSAAPPEQAGALEAALAGLQILQPRVESASVVVPLALEVPEAWLAAPPPAAASAAPLTEAELEALDQALQPWDAFLAYTIKQLALDSADEALRGRLFTLLLDSRYQLAALLSGEAAAAAGDPVRGLFVEAWNELRAILGASQLRTTLFLEAGDALLVLDRAAPGLGARVSADGLRQLARTLRPGDAGDPLAYGWEVDAELLRLFEVEAIAEPPRRSWIDFLIRSAHAGEARALDAWVPRRDELAAYEARVGELLEKTAAAELQRASLAAEHARVYRYLVPTTALIESCWRQYVLRGGKAQYLRSNANSVGIMQVNQRVWRGFYDVKRLRWDTAYNARAGAQILMRYLKDYAIPYAERTGNAEHAPRAAYAVYNAGPRAVGRFAKEGPHPREQRVDDKLWTLYRGIAAGGRADLRTCGVNGL
jgi:hypothetical protein